MGKFNQHPLPRGTMHSEIVNVTTGQKINMIHNPDHGTGYFVAKRECATYNEAILASNTGAMAGPIITKRETENSVRFDVHTSSGVMLTASHGFGTLGEAQDFVDKLPKPRAGAQTVSEKQRRQNALLERMQAAAEASKSAEQRAADQARAQKEREMAKERGKIWGSWS